jgi:hypothetical protein
MKKFGLGNLFQYNGEMCVARLFGKIEIYWRDGAWCRPSEWVFEYDYTRCKCVILEAFWFGITLLGKDCEGKCFSP